MKTCLSECTKWTLNVNQLGSSRSMDKGKKPKLHFLASIPTPHIKRKLFSEPVFLHTDLIMEEQACENIRYIFGEDVDNDFRRIESYDSNRISSQDGAHLDQQKEITASFPLSSELHFAHIS